MRFEGFHGLFVGFVFGFQSRLVVTLFVGFHVSQSLLIIVLGFLQVGLRLTFGFFQQMVGTFEVGFHGAVLAVEDKAGNDSA